MHIELLSEQNLPAYLSYLKASIAQEPDMMCADHVDEALIRAALPYTTSLLAIENGTVLGRLEYHFYTCLQDGCRMAYVNWVYVTAAHRHQGIAQALFREFENQCRKSNIDQYYLIQASNPGAHKFYSSFQNAESAEERILRKNIIPIDQH